MPVWRRARSSRPLGSRVSTRTATRSGRVPLQPRSLTWPTRIVPNRPYLALSHRERAALSDGTAIPPVGKGMHDEWSRSFVTNDRHLACARLFVTFCNAVHRRNVQLPLSLDRPTRAHFVPIHWVSSDDGSDPPLSLRKRPAVVAPPHRVRGRSRRRHAGEIIPAGRPNPPVRPVAL